MSYITLTMDGIVMFTQLSGRYDILSFLDESGSDSEVIGSASNGSSCSSFSDFEVSDDLSHGGPKMEINDAEAKSLLNVSCHIFSEIHI